MLYKTDVIASKPLLTELLNLADIEVEDYSIELGHIVLHVEAFSYESTYPHCGTVSKNVHQNHFHPVRDLPVMNRPVTLMVNLRQFKCHVCGKPFSEALDFIDKRRRFTNRFENQVVWSLINSDISNTAKMFDLSNDEVFSILKHVGDRDINPNLQIVKRLGIDEISMRKFHKNYVVVLVDLDLQKPLSFIDSRKKDVI
ncbi:MAG: helix-turn-helix domain-containing protein [Cyanobacteriota bacterium]